jgi:rod shape-determining protein rodA
MKGIDTIGVLAYLVLCIFAILNIYSVDEGLGTKQFIFFVLSLILWGVIFAIRYKFFENFAPIFYLGGVLLLLGLFPFGKEILGQKNWYKIGSFTMQPVEFMKIGTALMLANFVSNGSFTPTNSNIFKALIIIGIPATIVLAIPDVGSLLVFFAFAIALYREGLNGRFFTTIGVFTIIFLISIYLVVNNINPLYEIIAIVLISIFIITKNFRTLIKNIPILGGIVVITIFLSGFVFFTPKILEKLPKHQRERVMVLYEGEMKYRDTSGYNLLYSKTAIGSGNIFGKGYREGSVTRGKFVPEQETDYIFCTVGEEWGFVGSTALILLYAFYIGRIYYLSEKQKSIFNRIFGYSFASILLMHFGINIGMVIGLFPTVGIPLPYFSYGGSSLVAFSIMTAIFFKLDYTDRNALV